MTLNLFIAIITIVVIAALALVWGTVWFLEYTTKRKINVALLELRALQLTQKIRKEGQT